MASSTVLVLSKSDYTEQSLVSLPSPPIPDFNALPQSTVLVRTTIIALTANNLSYARGGSILHWWSTYPVPPSLPKPYNSSSTYGIVPAWGYGTILASSIPSLQPNTTLWGYFPVSTLPVPLLLKPSPGGAMGHWIEHSPHREEVMPLYQRYLVHSPSSLINPSSLVLDKLAWRALIFPLWECGYLLNRFVFPQQTPSTAPALHPSSTHLTWPSSSSDLTNALVILLAASSKTALCFAQQLKYTRHQDRTSPLAVIGVTSESSLPFARDTHWFDDMLLYTDLQTTLTDLLATAREKRLSHVVVVDFGGRNAADQKLHATLAAVQPPIPTTIIGVGAEPKILTAAERATVEAQNASIGKVKMNTSNLRAAAIEMLGEQAYFDDVEVKWREFLEAGGAPGIRLRWGEGMEGKEGVGAAWRALCGREGTKVQPDEGMVFRL
jgi:hypothetical protein